MNSTPRYPLSGSRRSHQPPTGHSSRERSKQADVDSTDYQTIATSLFRPRPWLDPSVGEVVQAVRADLDGNGIDEVLVVYEHVADPSRGQPGDFSLVFAHAANEGETGAKYDVLFSYATPGGTVDTSPAQASVAAIADLNGDGTMEVVVRSSVNGTTAIDVVEWTTSGPVTVLVAALLRVNDATTQSTPGREPQKDSIVAPLPKGGGSTM